MIVKPYEGRSQQDPRLRAGARAEKQMAHYLDRQFGPSDRFFLLHDLRFEFEGDTAQIDHLVVHPYGAAIVESKSVSTAVRINQHGEWERKWNRSWTGMADPLLQGERQGKLLKRLLHSRQDELLDKVLLGALQGTFTHMALDVYAAISDGGRIQRAKNQAPDAMKADAVPDAVEALVKKYQRASRLLGSSFADFANSPRSFNRNEVQRIARFLHAQHRALNSPVESPTPEGALPRFVTALCKACGGRDLDALLGRWGPYVKCRSCSKNTAVRETCAECKTTVRFKIGRRGLAGSCEGCGARVEVLIS